MSKPILTDEILKKEAVIFSEAESQHEEPSLYGVTDGKAVGTYLEHKFTKHLSDSYQTKLGNSAKGIDLPDLNVDIKVTSEKQPQSSCPFQSARQKVFGLGYSLLVFVYDKKDNATKKVSNLKILHTIFIESKSTGDYTMTRRLIEMVTKDGANEDDLVAYFEDRNLPMDDIAARLLAAEILKTTPTLGYLTISNALQWRLQYTHAIREAGQVSGVFKLVK